MCNFIPRPRAYNGCTHTGAHVQGYTYRRTQRGVHKQAYTHMRTHTAVTIADSKEWKLFRPSKTASPMLYDPFQFDLFGRVASSPLFGGAHMQTHTYRHTQNDTHIQTYTKRRTHTDVHIQAYTYRHTHTDVHIQAYTNRRTQTDVHIQSSPSRTQRNWKLFRPSKTASPMLYEPF